MLTSETIMFAVQAGLRLHGAIRKSYVDGTRSRSLVLPLPRSPGIRLDAAVSFFGDLDDASAAQFPRGVMLARKSDNQGNLDPEEKRELLNLYLAYLSIHDPDAFALGDGTADDSALARQSSGSMTETELSSLFTIRQWETSEPGVPSAFQRIAGTLVNTAVDYFLETPGRISEDRPEGRALKSFLTTIDELDFSEIAAKEILPSLMIAVVDSVAANPDLVSGGRDEQLFIENITRSFATSAKEHLADAPTTERQQASVWLNLVARSIVKGGAETVLSNPQRFLGVKEGAETALVQRVGKTLSDLVIGKDKLTFRPLFSAEGMTSVARSLLESLAENPELLRIPHDGITRVLGAVAGSVAKLREPFSKEMFPEIVRLIIEKSAENMDALWGKSFKKAEHHLLVTATKTLLAEISKKPANQKKWGLHLSTSQVLASLDAVLDEVVENPSWLIKRAGKTDPILGEAVKAITGKLREIEGSRLTAEAGVAVLQTGIEAVAMRLSFLDKLSDDAAGATRTALRAALDAIFDEVFDDGADAKGHWKLAQSSALVAVTEIALEELAERKALDSAAITSLRTAVRAELEDPRAFDIDRFRERLSPAA